MQVLLVAWLFDLSSWKTKNNVHWLLQLDSETLSLVHYFWIYVSTRFGIWFNAILPISKAIKNQEKKYTAVIAIAEASIETWPFVNRKASKENETSITISVTREHKKWEKTKPSIYCEDDQQIITALTYLLILITFWFWKAVYGTTHQSNQHTSSSSSSSSIIYVQCAKVLIMWIAYPHPHPHSTYVRVIGWVAG